MATIDLLRAPPHSKRRAGTARRMAMSVACVHTACTAAGSMCAAAAGEEPAAARIRPPVHLH